MNDDDGIYNHNVPAMVTSPFLPSSPEKRLKFEEVMSVVLPQLGSHKGKLIAAQVMIALKIEGILGDALEDRDIKLIQTVKDAVLEDPHREKQALSYANLLQLNDSPEK